MIRPADALDVQLALRRLTRETATTRQLDGLEVQYPISRTYLLTLDEDELDSLARDADSDHQFKEAYDRLKLRCLTYPDYLRQ